MERPRTLRIQKPLNNSVVFGEQENPFFMDFGKSVKRGGFVWISLASGCQCYIELSQSVFVLRYGSDDI